MFVNFETYLTPHASLTLDELHYIRSLSIERKLRRKQFLLCEGEVCRYKAFVAKGLLRHYRVTEDGTENIIRFVAENEWTTEPESFMDKTPSKYNIEALEDTEVLLWTHENMHKLIAAIPQVKTVLDKLMLKSIGAIQNRLFMHLSYTAEEKYQDFISSFPNIFARVPLHMVASYLGVSSKTLTRIRHEQLKQQKAS